MKAPPMIVSIFHIAHEVFEIFKLKIIQKLSEILKRIKNTNL